MLVVMLALAGCMTAPDAVPESVPEATPAPEAASPMKPAPMTTLRPVDRPERDLGTLTASLGDPTDPGFWVMTSRVSEAQKGRLFYPPTGGSVLVDLRPFTGEGAQVSLAALRVVGAPLTGTFEMQLFLRP
ncbi:D-galactarate dehydratase [Actibacterium sp.]|uniref:D-galactarate dehydratase n=1 Tax=Actibacterium sp. TaxID=1872125 RepID=UPI0035674BE0